MNSDGSPSTLLESVGDVACHWEHAGARNSREFDAWCHFENNLHSILDNVRRSGQIRIDQLDGAAFCASVSGLFKEPARASNPAFLARSEEHDTTGLILSEIAEKGLDVAPLERQVRGALYNGAEILEIVGAHLAAAKMYLETGDKEFLWPPQRAYAADQVGDWGETQDLEHIITLAQRLDDEEGNTHHEARINQAIAELGTLYLSNRLTGRAIATLSILTDETVIEDFLEKMAALLTQLKEEYGEAFYQNEYSYALSQMRNNPILKAKFEARLAPGATPLIEEAERHIKKIGDTEFMIELFHTDAEIEAVLEDGSAIPLPYREHWVRTLTDYRTPNEKAITEQRKSISFEQLPEEVQNAIEAKAKQAEANTSEEQVERLVCGLGFRLLTTDVSNEDEWKIMLPSGPRGPHNGENISGEVKKAEELGIGWVITEYSGSYLAWEGFRVSDVAKVAPEGANAFWFSSDPLMVVPPYKGHFSDNTTRDMSEVKYIVTPAIFYKVEKR